MINAIANISLNPITFFELIVVAILARSLPGRLSLLALLTIISSIAGTSLSAAWMRRHIATPRFAPIRP